ncbi:MAG: PP2C family protein-serine/threonine phosphatase [Acetobacteraceae bacterium]
MNLRAKAISHPGNHRGHNEDACLDRADLGLWVVADGAGGHDAGEVASGRIVAALDAIPAGLGAPEMLAEVRDRIETVHRGLLVEAAQRGPRSMIASTAVILCVRDTHYACLWAGDSRCYLLRDGALEQVSHDHSLVQELVDAGAIAEDAAESHPQANVITRAVGGTEDMQLDKITDRIQPGDRFLLCSDGITKSIGEAAIAALLPGPDPAAALIDAALDSDARDNITVVVVDVAE